MVERIKNSLSSLDTEVIKDVLELLYEGKTNKNITIDGAGRSGLSLELFKDLVEDDYGIRIKSASNANLRPLKENDIFIANSRSGSGKVLEHAKFAKRKGLKTIFITSNKALSEEFDYTIIIPKGFEKEKQKRYAPLGTEFEQASAVLLSSIANAYDTNSVEKYEALICKIIDEMNKNLENIVEQKEAVENFVNTISEYLRNNKKIYFIGLGANNIIAKVAAIRYGHLHSEEKNLDLKVIYEGYWKSREEDDLSILISGSGKTDQIITYALQSLHMGMQTYAITSFKDSLLAALAKNKIIITGRSFKESKYNMPSKKREKYVPLFELNAYITLDSLLAEIAYENDIKEGDMKKTHRDKELE